MPRIVMLLLCMSALPAAERVVATGGRSDYAIACDPAAPATVKRAAEELRRVLAAATGATLDLAQAPRRPVLWLGAGAPARQAGIDPEQLPWEGYRIVTRGADVLIVGRDTPDGQRTPEGGFSRGTEFGVDEFLERVVGVRWLLPGEVGEDIPRQATLSVPDLDLTGRPAFLFRQVNVGNRTPVVQQWLTRNRVSGFSTLANTACSRLVFDTHSWAWNLPEEVVAQHPEFRAVRGERNKFCTSNLEAVELFAASVGKWLDQRPQWWMGSLSPSDGQSFCECERCRADYEQDWFGHVSVTPRLLKFYNEVARRVARTHPNRKLGAYVYGSYSYPPSQPIAMEPNVQLDLYPLGTYGFGLYKPAYRDQFERLLAEWRKVTPEVGYGNYSTWLRDDCGAPYGPGLEILALELPAVHRHGFQTVSMVGSAAWGYAGVTNYLTARLEWDPTQDVAVLYTDWLKRAYGGGWQAMDRLYRMLDEALKQYKTTVEPVEYRGSNYELTYDVIKHVHLPLWSRIESLYLEAMSRAGTDAQRARLQMFGDNLIIFQHALRQVDLLPEPEKSPFYRTDEQFAEWVKQHEGSLALCATTEGETIISPIWAPERRVLRVPRLKPGAAPVADGRLGADEYPGAGLADAFRLAGGRRPASHLTTVRAVCDEQRLYLAFDCRDDQPVAVTDAPRDDARRIYAGDTVEVFLDAAPDDPANPVWHLALTPGNAQWDGHGSNSTPNLEWTSAAAVTADGWVAELAIPWKSLGLKSAPILWRGNFGRYAPKHRQVSSWCSVEQWFHEPGAFGEWHFAP